MSFLQPAVLWALPALLIPILIHLWHRRRHQSMAWAAMQFLRQAVLQTRGQRRLRNFLILACRVLAVVALTVAVARPLSGGWQGWSWFAPPNRIFIIADRSPSMASSSRDGGSVAESNFDAMRRAASERDFPPVRFLFPNRETVVATRDWARPRAFCLSPDSASCDVPGRVEEALAHLAEDDYSGQTEIWISSDLSETDWAPADSRWPGIRQELGKLAKRTGLRVWASRSLLAPNATLSLISVERRGPRSVRLRIAADHRGLEGRTIPLVVRIAGMRLARELTFDRRRIEHIEDLDVTEDEGWGQVSLGPDGNLRDNDVYFAFPAREAGALLLAGPDGFTASAMELLAAGEVSGRKVSVRRARSIRDAPASSWTAVVAHEAFDLPEGGADHWILPYLEDGGTLLLFPDRGHGSAFAGIEFGDELEMAAGGPPARVTEWHRRDDLLGDTAGGEPLPFDLLAIRRFRPLQASEGVVLARVGEERAPFVLRKPVGAGVAVAVATRPDDDWSNLADGPVLLPLVHRLLGEALARRQSKLVRPAGEIDWRPVPDGIRTVAPGGSGRGDPTWDEGVYALAGGELFAVNRPAAEGLPDPLPRSQVRELLGTEIPLHFAGDEADPSPWKLSSEIWRLFVAALLVFLLVEAFLSLPERRGSPRAALS